MAYHYDCDKCGCPQAVGGKFYHLSEISCGGGEGATNVPRLEQDLCPKCVESVIKETNFTEETKNESN